MSDSDEFYDKCYGAWRSGHNPDLVNRDRFDNLQAQGFEPDEISWRDCYPKQEEPYPETETEETT